MGRREESEDMKRPGISDRATITSLPRWFLHGFMFIHVLPVQGFSHKQNARDARRRFVALERFTPRAYDKLRRQSPTSSYR